MMLFTAAAANIEHKITNNSRMIFMVFLRLRSFFSTLKNIAYTSFLAFVFLYVPIIAYKFLTSL